MTLTHTFTTSDGPGTGDAPTVPQLGVLVDRACRGALTPGEGRALRAAVADLRGQLAVAGHELTNQRETFTIADDALTARAERAEQRLAAVLAECDAIEAEPYHIGDYEAARRVRAAAALGGAQQPECTGCSDTGACAGGPRAHPDQTTGA